MHREYRRVGNYDFPEILPEQHFCRHCQQETSWKYNYSGKNRINILGEVYYKCLGCSQQERKTNKSIGQLYRKDEESTSSLKNRVEEEFRHKPSLFERVLEVFKK